MKRVRDLMTPDVEVLEPDDTVEEAAKKMRAFDVGSFPVCDDLRVVGVLTDRDVALRVTAEGRDPSATLVRDVMSRDVVCATEDQDLRDVAELMRHRRLRRLPIVDRRGRLVGLISVGRLAKVREERTAGLILKGVVRPDPKPDSE
jgi:CBS domain-containing protein